MTEEKSFSKSFSKEFQNELLDLIKMCLENHTDGMTLTLEYPHAKVDVEMTFRVEKVGA